MSSAAAPAAPPKAEKSSNFFLGFLFLNKDQKEALSAVYAYCRLIDDIVDEGALTKEQARAELDRWVDEIGLLFDGKPTDPVALRLRAPIERFALPREPFLEMIRGCRMDLEQTAFREMSDLESYMRGVACSVGQLAVRIFGYKHTSPQAIDDFARDFGYAFQLTNIIRDVGADLELGRVYLPEAEMARFGYGRAKAVSRVHDESFDRLMRSLYDRAKMYYRRGRSAVDFRDRPSLLPAEVMAHIYEGLLDEIAGDGFRVLFDKHRLSGWRKAQLAGKAWLYCHGIHV